MEELAQVLEDFAEAVDERLANVRFTETVLVGYMTPLTCESYL